ncbi:MAG TPA: aminotransferase class III-fold pyridoxal phosphate-dependent enzyme [Candidatus Methylomirabilis sp.]
MSGPRGDRIVQAYRRANPRSEALYARAEKTIPGGITHDIRHLRPFPLYVEGAQGSRKRTADGRELIDYWMGHGALFLGHNHPQVMGAVAEQAARGTHYGACHEPEVRWAEWVTRLVPSAEKVRFTASGTEATQLAMRLARAFTGRERVLKFEGHFHGWHDYATAGVKPPYEMPGSSGIPGASAEAMVLCPPNDLPRAEALFDRHPDIAAAILEPAGGTAGTIPTDAAFLRGLRELTRGRGVVLIFDEVISGFRYAPGGAQEYFGVTPDLTSLAKILAGGLPGGAVCGRADIMDLLAFRDDAAWNRRRRVAHAGTFNANPLCAAAGIAALELVADGERQRAANAAGQRLRRGMNEVIYRARADACVYGESSIFTIFLEPCRIRPRCDRSRCTLDHTSLQTYRDPGLYHLLRLAMILHGVDVPAYHSWMSCVHSDEDLGVTVAAFEGALAMLLDEGLIGRADPPRLG